MHVQSTGAFSIIGVISALLFSSIFISQALRLRAAGNGARSVHSPVWRKGHHHVSPKRKVQPLKSQGSCGTDIRVTDRAVWQTQERSQRCHTGGDGEGSPGLGSRKGHWQSWCGDPWVKTEIRWASYGSRPCYLTPAFAFSSLLP